MLCEFKSTLPSDVQACVLVVGIPHVEATKLLCCSGL